MQRKQRFQSGNAAADDDGAGMSGIAVWNSEALASGPGQLLLSATLYEPQRHGLHIHRVMLVRPMVIRPGEIDENVSWSGEHHRPSVAGCMVRY